jgi:hypothetical protein
VEAARPRLNQTLRIETEEVRFMDLCNQLQCPDPPRWATGLYVKGFQSAVVN